MSDPTEAPDPLTPAQSYDLVVDALAAVVDDPNHKVTADILRMALTGLRAALRAATPDPAEPGLPRLRFGDEVILDCGPRWGGEQRLYVGWIERTESLNVGGQFVSSGASREYALLDGLDAPNEEHVAARYQPLARSEEPT